METTKDQIFDVRSVVEAVVDEEDDVPIYQVESLCMRCGENVCIFLSFLALFLWVLILL